MSKIKKMVVGLLSIIILLSWLIISQYIGWLLSTVLFFVLGSEFVNGWTDAPNAIATVVSSRAISFRWAIAMAVVLNILGAISGTAVAQTIGRGIVKLDAINLETIAAALLGIILFSSVAARYGIPTSESHQLVAGLTGAAVATSGWQAIVAEGWSKVGIGVFSALVMGYFGSRLICKLIIKTCSKLSPSKSRQNFDRMHIVSAAVMAFDHGLNDGQKFIGIFSLALLLGGQIDHFYIPAWVIGLCALTMGAGTSIGGKKIIATLGEKITKLESWQGFGATTNAAIVIFGASHFGIPLSTTHSIVSSVTGAGTSKRISAVRWQYPWDIVKASALTFPICGGIAFITCKILLLFK